MGGDGVEGQDDLGEFGYGALEVFLRRRDFEESLAQVDFEPVGLFEVPEQSEAGAVGSSWPREKRSPATAPSSSIVARWPPVWSNVCSQSILIPACWFCSGDCPVLLPVQIWPRSRSVRATPSISPGRKQQGWAPGSWGGPP